MSQTIQLEAFNTDLHSARILLQGPFPANKIPPIMEYVQQLREPFKKKILITNTALSLSRSLSLQYDATFQAKDTNDWQLILTYLTYAPKPTLVIAEEVAIPDGLWSRLAKTITFVYLLSKPLGSYRPYDAIFFAPMKEVQNTFAEHTYKILQSIYRGNYTYAEHKEILQELRVAGAGVAWTNIGEEKQGGSIYWYDPVSSHQGDTLTKQQVSELLRWIADQVHNE
jgi:hypothetical protein